LKPTGCCHSLKVSLLGLLGGHRPAKLNWVNDHTLQIDDLTFILDFTTSMESKQSTGNSFVLAKPRAMVESYVTRFGKKDINVIFELGIYKGGSCLLYYKLFEPEKIIAIDHLGPCEPLESYIEEHQLSSRIRTFYEVEQADRNQLTEILDHELAGKPIDLVIDDASHLFDETKASFNILFPYLNRGGFYVIEDWGWAHWPGEHWQKGGAVAKDQPALTNLIFEIVMLSASRCDLIESVSINHDTVIIKRGMGLIEDTEFNISKMYHSRGKAFVPSI